MAKDTNYWLVKCEPHETSFDDLKVRPKRTGYWRGVRNYQARNFIRDGMNKGDLAFFYHSNCDEPGVAGIADIVKAGYPDPSQFDKKHRYYDEKATDDNPRWFSFDVKWKKKIQILRPSRGPEGQQETERHEGRSERPASVHSAGHEKGIRRSL